MIFGGYLGVSLLDWPGKVSTVVFTRGCNFLCHFCHNRDLVIDEGKVEKLEEDEIVRRVKKRSKLIDGVVITGGEPTLHKGLVGFCGKIKALELMVKLDTNGTNYIVLKELIDKKQINCVAMDIKSDWRNYARVVGKKGVAIKNIKKTLELILKSDLEYELRTTVVPEIHKEQMLVNMAQEIIGVKRRLKIKKPVEWTWQNFRGENCLDERFNNKKGYALVKIKGMKKRIEKAGVIVGLRGWSAS